MRSILRQGQVVRPRPFTPVSTIRALKGFGTTTTMSATATATAQTTIDRLNKAYEEFHKAFEDQFWATKMDLKVGSVEELAKNKTAYENFLGDAANLEAVKKASQDPDLTEQQKKVLAIMERTFKTYIIEDSQAKELKEKLNTLEAELSAARNDMKLGYLDPNTGEFVKASSVSLRNTMRVSEDEAVRKACYEGARTIGPFVAEGFLEIVKARNRMARAQGYEDFYDMKVTQAEGFSKKVLFGVLDDLETKTRPIMEAARKHLAEAKGASALEPWNTSFVLAGDTEKAMDPYFPFEDAVDVWARTFAALNINYRGATMTLDLCDRDKKYSNGFCHWPIVAWRKFDGSLVPSKANFTSLATPNQIGSGKTALVTLLHEGGHAAHFANIDQNSPFFGQERAPFSVATAENQSMFLDAMSGDSAWMGRYCFNRDGKVIPWDIIEQHKSATHPYEVFGLRAMIAVPYFEKALYEMPESDLTVENLLALGDRIEHEIQGGLSARPLLSVPHILADEASCYYHGYVLAEMSVHHTRGYFKAKYGGHLVDNPKIGEDLAEHYWKPGNSEMFLDMVQKLTGKPLTADAWVEELKQPIGELLKEEKEAYEAAVVAGPKYPPGTDVDLGMRIILAHGDEVIADTEKDGLSKACATFKEWVRKNYFSS